jgi:hypothetical protein
LRRFPSLISGVIVLAMFEAAFVGEIVRAGIQSVPKGQCEAARHWHEQFSGNALHHHAASHAQSRPTHGEPVHQFDQG